MTTSQLVLTVVIVVVALALIGLMISSMRKRSRADDRARAAQLRDRADTGAAGLPDAEARAEQAEVDAERAHAEARRADEHLAEARAEVDQERAIQEDRIRSADRLDPDVDHAADDYAPRVVTPAGPSNVQAATGPDPVVEPVAEPVDTTPRDGSAGADDTALRDRLGGDPAGERPEGDTPTGGTHRA